MSATTPTNDQRYVVQYTSIKHLRPMKLQREDYGFGSCRAVNDFEKLDRIGEGTYGVVYKAKDTSNGQIVALKQVRVDAKGVKLYGLSEAALREISILKRMRHENIVRLKEIAVSKHIHGIFLVMEFCDQDLACILDHMAFRFTDSQVKCVARQLFKGLAYMHERFVLHRDLKVSNLLINNDGILKIADFGLARPFGEKEMRMTQRVVTLWYRCPELLLGCKTQTEGVDMWAAGCILGELLLHKPLMPGQNEMEQLEKIISLLGTPTTAIWPDMEELPMLKSITLREQPYSNMQSVFECASPQGVELLYALFAYDPKRRMSAVDALKHEYFSESPLACEPALMPSFPQIRARKRKRKSST